uniref:Uncharacterized protein n=1 Tax=Avena sativa TaxID=4498 RepID=A0ACD5ZY37_AVESA
MVGFRETRCNLLVQFSRCLIETCKFGGTFDKISHGGNCSESGPKLILLLILQVTTYRGLPDGNLAILQSYIDEDNLQSFYTLSWASDLDGTPLLVAGGGNGVIRVINCATEKLFKSFVGHGDSINEIRTQPLKPSLFISASKDESVRLWNAHTGICILIFAGGGGHRNEVLSVDFHPSDIYRIASCGMDNTVKIWSMKEFWPYVEKSFTWTDLPSKFPTKYVQFPLMTAVVHANYVDCTRWLGDFVLSKSVDSEIVLWEPKTKDQGPGEGSIDVLQKYPVPDTDIWFIKFSCDFHFNQLAIARSLPAARTAPYTAGMKWIIRKGRTEEPLCGACRLLIAAWQTDVADARSLVSVNLMLQVRVPNLLLIRGACYDSLDVSVCDVGIILNPCCLYFVLHSLF